MSDPMEEDQKRSVATQTKYLDLIESIQVEDDHSNQAVEIESKLFFNLV